METLEGSEEEIRMMLILGVFVIALFLSFVMLGFLFFFLVLFLWSASDNYASYY